MTLHDLRPVHSTYRSALVRFVAVGLLATVESFLGGGLPLPRLARELGARIDALAEVGPPARVLTRLRWLHREVSRLDAALRDAGRTELGPGERAQLEATLRVLRDCVATLLVPGPLDPAGAGRPAGGSATASGVGVATGVATVLAEGPAAGDRPSTVTAIWGGPSSCCLRAGSFRCRERARPGAEWGAG